MVRQASAWPRVWGFVCRCRDTKKHALLQTPLKTSLSQVLYSNIETKIRNMLQALLSFIGCLHVIIICTIIIIINMYVRIYIYIYISIMLIILIIIILHVKNKSPRCVAGSLVFHRLLVSTLGFKRNETTKRTR